MNFNMIKNAIVIFILVNLINISSVFCMSKTEKSQLKEKVLSMFDHAFESYMKYAYPADELMPLSCKGRYRSSEFSRGDIDEVLGNFTLTLVDSLDTLALLGRVDQFETAVKNVIETTHFDRDLIVSVFESNIRMLGGLLSGHVSLIHLRDNHYPNRFKWYKGELLDKALDLGNRLLPAFNTTTGLPISRINLKYGITNELLSNDKNKYTCTACAGTLLLEFVFLSRLTGDKIYEEKVMKAMDYLWEKRNKISDLVGTVINVYDGEWAVKDASIGAGIDSYYEYLFKGYMLMGDETLLYRFNRHYDSIMKYMSLNTDFDSTDNSQTGDGSCMKTVHMHMPNRQSRNYIDALLAFWPGVQVLKGDLKGAIKMHESLHKIVKKHDFLPEAVLFDHSVHWSNHPLRPEFLESTYYLYRATKDDHYLNIAKNILHQLEKHSRVKCGYAAIADVKTKQHEDRMDSFVYAETFKYLYLMFVDDTDNVLFNIDEFIFTTEAHLIPLNIADYTEKAQLNSIDNSEVSILDNSWKHKSCPTLKYLFGSDSSNQNMLKNTLRKLRDSVSNNNDLKCQSSTVFTTNPQNLNNQLPHINSLNKLKSMPLRAADFVAGRKDHMEILNRMGIKLTTMQDGRVQLVHKTSEASNFEDAEMGILFMTEMLELSKQQNFQLKSNILADEYKSMSLVLINEPFNGKIVYTAGPAQFGYDLRTNSGVFGRLMLTDPIDGCADFNFNYQEVILYDKILVSKRGGCMFVDKVRRAEQAGALGMIIIDNSDDTSYSTSTLFAMSGDGVQNVSIPSVFLFGREGNDLLWNMRSYPSMVVYMGDNSVINAMNGIERAITFNKDQIISVLNPKSILLNVCHLDILSQIFKLTKQKTCELNDEFSINNIYELFKREDKSNQESKISYRSYTKILKFDEAIELIIKDENTGIKRELNMDLSYILNMIPGEESKSMSQHELTARVFDQLIKRLESKTNFISLKNAQEYLKMLYNYVNSQLNNNTSSFTDHDRLMLTNLTEQIDFKN